MSTEIDALTAAVESLRATVLSQQPGAANTVRGDLGDLRLLTMEGRGWRMSHTSTGTTQGRFSIQGTTNSFATSITAFDILTSGHILPGTDNTQNLGSGSFRLGTVFAGNGAINTSDQHEKTPLRALNAAEIAAAKELAASIGIYQWLASVAEKGGDKARLHVGLIAQDVEKVMQKHGLDPWRYGFLCKDPITKRVKKTETREVAKSKTVTETYTEIEIIDGTPTRVEKTREVKQPVVEMVQVVDAKGQPVFTEREEPVDDLLLMTMPPQRRTRTVLEPVLYPVPVMVEEDVEIEVDEPAGERLGLRYDQVYGFICRALAEQISKLQTKAR